MNKELLIAERCAMLIITYLRIVTSHKLEIKRKYQVMVICKSKYDRKS